MKANIRRKLTNEINFFITDVQWNWDAQTKAKLSSLQG